MENPTYTAPSQQTTALSKLNGYQTNLLLRFQNIIELATVFLIQSFSTSPRSNPLTCLVLQEQNQDLTMVATQAHQIQVHTASMIKTVEDLLTLTRALKEAWLFGQMGEDGENTSGVSPDKKDKDNFDEDAEFVIDWLKSKIREGTVVDEKPTA
ncbi:hypothetical protein H072_8047 [Dactylellina haptotyla CBS 200.50]|uniref:Mediator of RNA polymerase II transcription subunit 22 n=1 Tax=Dactylellina haptotyla (strain CBS 200.50) TaxID=1284197 RepID=S8BG33_DACHA|nr:hypothetical protein H072_8047 [Dactylellina haptotyla CBS 200.50]